MKQISGSRHFISSPVWLTLLSLRECKLAFCLVLRRVNVGRISCSIAKDLRFDCSKHVNTKGVGKLDLFQRVRWYSSTKTDKYSGCYLFLSWSEQVVYFHETDIISFWVINYSYLQRFFKIAVLKTLYTIHRKITVSESLFNQQVACYSFNKRLRRFLVDIAKLSRTPLLQEHLETPDSVFMEHTCNYNIIKSDVNYPKWLFQPFETLIKIEMYTCEIKITWTWEIILSSLLIL